MLAAIPGRNCSQAISLPQADPRRRRVDFCLVQSNPAVFQNVRIYPEDKGPDRPDRLHVYDV